MNTDSNATNSLVAQATSQLVKPLRFPAQPREYKVVPLRDCPLPTAMKTCETPEQAAAYWRQNIETHPLYDADRECCVVFMLNTRRRIKGHYLVAIGTVDTVVIHPREVYRLAIMAGGISAIILAHNHPSGSPEPSEADIRITRELFRAGQILKMELVDHIIVGNPTHVSLRERGYLFA